MKKATMLLTKVNKDVIATSVACTDTDKYHYHVLRVNINPEGHDEYVIYTYNDISDDWLYQATYNNYDITSKKSDAGAWFYSNGWNSGPYTKCNGKHKISPE